MVHGSMQVWSTRLQPLHAWLAGGVLVVSCLWTSHVLLKRESVCGTCGTKIQVGVCRFVVVPALFYLF